MSCIFSVINSNILGLNCLIMNSYGFPEQLDKSRQECDELSHQLKLQHRETERVRQESALDIEKVMMYN